MTMIEMFLSMLMPLFPVYFPPPPSVLISFFCLHFSLCELSIFCRYTDTMGASKLVDHMRRFEEHYGVAFTPCQLLQDMAKANKKFYN